MLELLPGYLLIFCSRVIDVSCATLRMLLLVRGRRLIAASIGFVEVVVYITALGYVVSRLNDPISVIIYGLGFASGNVVGSLIEERIGIGNVTIQVITLEKPMELAQALRDAGFGVTTLQGHGREGEHKVLHIILARKRTKELMKIVEEWDKAAFITVSEAKATLGGVGMASRYRLKK